ncbi:hypothetical protein DFH06DRAFT_1426368 [Mycena polygramma]|nr:hypothetical protein DFH06DRAFT_1426368 [Mycena polygramma]
MSFEPRRPPVPNSPPAYEMPSQYGNSKPVEPLSHRITAPFSFDPDAGVDLSSPSHSLPTPLPADSSHVPSYPPHVPSFQKSYTPAAHFGHDPTNPHTSFDGTCLSPELSVFAAAPKPKGSRKRTIPPPNPPTAPSPDPEGSEAVEFEIVIWTYPAAKKSVSVSRKPPKKVAKPEPTTHGPISANTDMTWGDLVDTFGELLETSGEFLVISSVQWRWLKPANSSWLPLRDARGHASLIKQVLSPPKAVSSTYIIVRMDEPMKAPPPVSMPWASRAGAGPSSGPGAFESTYRAVMGFDDEPSDDDDNPKKKVPFDQALEEEMQAISDKYPAGTCSVHPDIECFHSRVNDLHFLLDRPKKIVWAAAIKNNTTTIFGPPLASKHFSAKAAIKKKGTQPATPAAPTIPDHFGTAPAGPSVPSMTPYANPYGYPSHPFPPPMPFPQFPSYHSPGYYGHPAGNMPPWQDHPRPRRRERSWDGSSPPRQSSSKRRREERLPDPPSSPAFSGGSVDEFLERYPDLPDGAKSFLLELGFDIGDDLSIVTEAQWKAAGLTLFGWNRVVKSYNKYKNSLRH